MQQRAAHDRSVACYRRAAAALTPPAELVRIPYQATQLAAYLRVPVGRGRDHEAAPPVVIMVPGLDSTKEELQATAEYLLARGMATLAIDGPGQGEAEYDLAIEPAYEKVAAAAVDYLATRADLDGGNIGLFGVSLGGYYAARAAAREKRLKAVVDLARPYRFDLDWDELPAQTRATFRVRSGAASDDEARAIAGALTLEEAAGEITTPLLIIGGGRDAIVPAYHQERLASEVAARRAARSTRTAATASPTAPTSLGPGWPTGWPPAYSDSGADCERVTDQRTGMQRGGVQMSILRPASPRAASRCGREALGQAEGPVPRVSVVVCD